jgi:hypothetical protein
LPSTSATPALAGGNSSSTSPTGAPSAPSPWSNYGINASKTAGTTGDSLASSYPTTPFPATSIPSPESAPTADNSLAPYPPGPTPNAYTRTQPGQITGQTPYPTTLPGNEGLAETPSVQAGPYGPPAGYQDQAQGYDKQALGGTPISTSAPSETIPQGNANSLSGYRVADERQTPPGANAGPYAPPNAGSPYSPSDVGDRYSSTPSPFPPDAAAPHAPDASNWGTHTGMAQRSEPMPPYHAPSPAREPLGAGNPLVAEPLGVAPSQPGGPISPPANPGGSPLAPNRFRPGGTSDYLGQPGSGTVYPSLSQGTVSGVPAHQATSYQPPPANSLPSSANVPPSSGSYQTFPSPGGSGRF